VQKVALIPGGATGIGRHIGLSLAAQGWSVALCARRRPEQAQATASDLQANGGEALAIEGDVSKPEDCERVVRDVLDWRGRIDALVHCAGPFHRMDVLAETPEGWREMFGGNLDSLFFMARLVAPVMIQQGSGRIVAFAMANADRLMAQTQVTAHYLAKVGVLGLVRSLAKRLAEHGITVNAISPGFVDSGSRSMDPDELAAWAHSIPAGHVGQLDDVTQAALYLLSDAAAYVTGTSLHVSGGWGI
jgi:3-oxoacyl-[acyl-carrier protein] reductase